MSTADDLRNVGNLLHSQTQARVTVQIVGHPDDGRFEQLGPCYRVTASVIDPESGQPEKEPSWKDISSKSSSNECLFVVNSKVEKLAEYFARVKALQKRKPLQLRITAEPLAAWKDKYASIEQTETVAGGSQPIVKLVAMPLDHK